MGASDSKDDGLQTPITVTKNGKNGVVHVPVTIDGGLRGGLIVGGGLFNGLRRRRCLKTRHSEAIFCRGVYCGDGVTNFRRDLEGLRKRLHSKGRNTEVSKDAKKVRDIGKDTVGVMGAATGKTKGTCIYGIKKRDDALRGKSYGAS